MKDYQKQAQKAYRTRQTKKGRKLVQVWVPTAEDAVTIKQIAQAMREKSNGGA